MNGTALFSPCCKMVRGQQRNLRHVLCASNEQPLVKVKGARVGSHNTFAPL